MAKAIVRKVRRPPARRLTRLILGLLKIVLMVVAAAAVWSAGFIGLNCYSRTATSASARSATPGPPGYGRDEVSTFLTLPEWYIVYNTDEYARLLASRPPSAFAYAGSIRQYWRYYGAVCDATKGIYPFSGGNHLMLAVIGSSFSIEYAIKGVYENTMGRLSEWISGRDTPEDAFAARTAAEYGTFMHTVPWYTFPFASRIGSLWKTTPARGPHMVRKWERRLALTAEYGVKAAYAWVLGMGTQAAYGAEDLRIHARVENARGVTVVTLPRYEAFTGQALALLQQGGRFVDIAGNDRILITVLTPASLATRELQADVVLDEPLLTDASVRRVGLAVEVHELHVVVARVQARGGRVEHFYDY